MTQSSLSLPTRLDAASLRQIALNHGADDAGLVSIDDPALDDQPRRATIRIADMQIRVEDGLVDKPRLTVTADSDTWIRFLRKEASLPWALLRGKIKMRGDPRLLIAFGRCFPS
jgi:hypothetical protein